MNTTSFPFYASATMWGTSECSGDWSIWGALTANDKLRYRYVASNYKLLQNEVAEGQGKHLEGLATLMGCSSEPFNQMVKNNFSDLFSNSKPNIQKIVR